MRTGVLLTTWALLAAFQPACSERSSQQNEFEQKQARTTSELHEVQKSCARFSTEVRSALSEEPLSPVRVLRLLEEYPFLPPSYGEGIRLLLEGLPNHSEWNSQGEELISFHCASYDFGRLLAEAAKATGSLSEPMRDSVLGRIRKELGQPTGLLLLRQYAVWLALARPETHAASQKFQSRIAEELLALSQQGKRSWAKRTWHQVSGSYSFINEIFRAHFLRAEPFRAELRGWVDAP